ncbi:MAG: response regulator, partial [Crocinitomicaceae bacterium]
EYELRDAKFKAEDLNRVKEMFMANMSHEIRTPMNAIIGLSEVLSESELSDFQRTSLDRIRSASDNLLHLINEILDLSKVESNEIELNNSFHYLEKTFKNSKELFEIEADKKNIKLIYDSNIDPELEFFTDKNRLNQVLINLLGNAIKFTDKGQVTLKIEQEEELKESLTVNISVIDTGIGIPKKDLKTIFENFSQARNNDENTYGGTGLGLSIAKKILLLMNSELKVNSKLGEGSTFYFTLKMPYRRNSSNVELNTIEQNIYKFENCKILVAEDNLTNQFLIKTILEKHGIATTVASNGIEALKILETENFDIILMDMRMPQLDGLETTKVIRNEFKNSTTPIIALTANASENDRKLCLEAGMNEFIVKPFKPNDLIAMIKKINKGNNKSSLLDIEKLNESTYNDPVFREKMIEIFINDSEKRCLEIENLIKNNELDKISVIAHSMKPALGHLAHEKLVLMANEIENEQDLSKKGFVELCQELISYTRDLIEELKNIPKMENPQPNREE